MFSLMLFASLRCRLALMPFFTAAASARLFAFLCYAVAAMLDIRHASYMIHTLLLLRCLYSALYSGDRRDGAPVDVAIAGTRLR